MSVCLLRLWSLPLEMDAADLSLAGFSFSFCVAEAEAVDAGEGSFWDNSKGRWMG